jgi:hypothetical protein
MFWKSLLIGFVLNNKHNLLNYNHTNLKLSYLDSIADSLPSDNVPQKPKIQETINDYSFKKNFFRNILNNGYDYRIDTNEFYEREKLRNITSFFEKMILLQNLENDNISQFTKLDLIENNIHIDSNNHSKYVSNINSGNLFSDW